jgi:hypothetical protein
MNWKLFSMLLATGLLGLVPGNGISCAGDEPDATDYFTSFFSRTAATADQSLRPFFYTQIHQYYTDDEFDPTGFSNTDLLEEWRIYAHADSLKDVQALVFDVSYPLLGELMAGKIPPELRGNQAAANLAHQPGTEALAYLRFARDIENYSAGRDWQAIVALDTVGLRALAREAALKSSKSRDPFLQKKWAFQWCKADFYLGQYDSCILHYDRNFSDKDKAAVKPLAMAYKAGSLFRTGRKKEAAYMYSKVFTETKFDRTRIYTSFRWSLEISDSTQREEYIAMGRNKKEKAALVGLLALGGNPGYETDIQRVHEMDPSSPLLPLLVSREISKIEEQYLSLYLRWPKNKTEQKYYSELSDYEKEQMASAKKLRGELTALLPRLVDDRSLKNRSFYAAAMAYNAIIGREWQTAQTFINKARHLRPDARVSDQLQLLRLLAATESPSRIEKEQEARLLPACRWLTGMAQKDKEFRVFCRNFFSESLARRYKQQNNNERAALCLGIADLKFIHTNNPDYYNSSSGLDYVQEELNAAATSSLYRILTKPTSEWERFLGEYTSFGRNAVVESAGTSYLREGQYAQAIDWLRRADSLPGLVAETWFYDRESGAVNVNPFFDYLNDWQRYDSALKKPMTKLALAQALLKLQGQVAREKRPEILAKMYYRWGSALYNMSFYGNAWMAVTYTRSGWEWDYGPFDKSWQREYYGVFKAKAMYDKAFGLSKNREFKAACLFLSAKCRQRQLQPL